jgi:hypothetical protein
MVVKSGSVSGDRYCNSLRLRREAEFHERSYVVMRTKD